MSKTNFATPIVKAMTSYTAPIAERRAQYTGTLLDFNERTSNLPADFVKKIVKQIKTLPWQVYPEDCFNTQALLAEYCGVTPDQLLLTNGSDQAIDLIFRTFSSPRAKVVIPKPSFTMFWQAAELLEQKALSPLYLADLSFPLDKVLALKNEQPQLIVICSPNNPTGTSLSQKNVELILQNFSSSLVYVDEAYAEFSGVTMVPLIKRYPNLVISRTFSKAFGLASLRLGYIIASAEHINELNKVRKPYDVNVIAYLAAALALKNKKMMQIYVDEVMLQAKPLVEEFFKNNGIIFYPSAANFLLFKPGGRWDTNKVAKLLEQAGFAVRPRSGPPIDDTIRLTIGTVIQMQNFITTYKKLFL